MSNPDAYYDPPEEHDALCTCGARESDHSEEGYVDADAMKKALLEIIDLVGRPHQGFIGKVEHLAKCALSICADADCECRKFVAVDFEDPPEED